MSFKRDGNDDNLLQNLNHQRVRELLSSHIPQDEAKLLSNGRLACMMCLHRPVFDTINMLAMHRRGKRHLFELSKFIKCKEEAELKDIKRKCLRPNMNTLEDDCQLSATLSNSAMLGSKRTSVKQYIQRHRRKQVLEIQPTLLPKVSPELKKTDQSQQKHSSVTLRHYLKNISRKSSLEKLVEKNRENYGIDLQKSSSTLPTSVSENPSRHTVKTAATTDNKTAGPNHEIKLRMDGWIKDIAGKWVKDPNVEFDSDEDETPPPPT